MWFSGAYDCEPTTQYGRRAYGTTFGASSGAMSHKSEYEGSRLVVIMAVDIMMLILMLVIFIPFMVEHFVLVITGSLS